MRLRPVVQIGRCIRNAAPTHKPCAQTRRCPCWPLVGSARVIQMAITARAMP
jgi:hypothetical protein